MKKYTIATILFACISSLSFGQKFRPQVHEIDFQVFSINKIPNVTYATKQALDFNFANGLRYRYHLNKSTAFRFGVFYRNAQCEFTPNAPTAVAHTEFKLGFEKELNLKRLQLYAGGDLMGGARNLRNGEYRLNTNQYGGSAFVGARYFISPNFSIALENDVYYLKQADGNKLNINPPETGLVNFLDSESGFNFVSVSACLHFKQQKKACNCPRHGKKRH
ncbi:MAG: hypothetical protein ACKVTZ_23980 [Bacteroidia bacterium]